MKKLFFILIFICLSSLFFAQSSIDFEISFENAAHHEVQVRAVFKGINSEILEVHMSCSSPGYYALFNFAKNIYSFKAYDSSGKILDIYRPNQHQWNIKNNDGTAIINYTIFGDYMDGTYNSIESRHAYLNIPATFIWAKDFENIPITLTVKKPRKDWKIITQLVPTKDPNIFTAPNLDYFIDSPVEVADFKIREWRIKSNDKNYKFRLALHNDNKNDDIDILNKFIESIIYEDISLFGELPEFDHNEYTFIINLLHGIVFDGMEHRNSSVLTSNLPLKHESYIRNLRMISHEFIHAWNGERLRPKSLIHFNLKNTNMSDELWFLEGFTSYYQDLIIERAGILKIDDYCEALKNRINYVYNSPGYKIHSLVEMSQKAVLFNGGVYQDILNLDNIYISYYAYGAVIALGLDLSLRKNYKNISLDDYIKLVWEKFGKNEIPYTNEDLLNLLEELTNDKDFSHNFFDKYIYGKELPDIKDLLMKAGLLLRKVNPNKASIGRLSNIRYENKKAIINNLTLSNEPLYKAGLDKDDIIIAIDNVPVTKQRDIEKVLSAHKPGDTVVIKFKRRGEEKTVSSITFMEDNELELVTFEKADLVVTQDIIDFRSGWLSGKSTYKLNEKIKDIEEILN